MKRCDCKYRPHLRETGYDRKQGATHYCPCCNKRWYEQKDESISSEEPAHWPKAERKPKVIWEAPRREDEVEKN